VELTGLSTNAPARSGVTFALGGGGAPGIAYHVGALRALHEVAGIDAHQADHIIGTSAGSIVATALRQGATWEEIAAMTGPDSAEPGEEESKLTARAWTSHVNLARRTVGVSWALYRTATRIPLPPPPRAVQRMFPSALLVVRDTNWAEARFGAAWPSRPLWLVTVDLDSGRRIVLSRPNRADQTGTLAKAVAASCAVPGIYAPVRIGRRRLVDGGVHSNTNFDLAARTGSGLAVCVAPMGSQPSRTQRSVRTLPRVQWNRQISKEAATVRRSGSHVLVIRPTVEEVSMQSLNVLKADNPTLITKAAYESTARYLDLPRVRHVLGRWNAS
jgi:NTE family protein